MKARRYNPPDGKHRSTYRVKPKRKAVEPKLCPSCGFEDCQECIIVPEKYKGTLYTKHSRIENEYFNMGLKRSKRDKLLQEKARQVKADVTRLELNRQVDQIISKYIF